MLQHKGESRKEENKNAEKYYRMYSTLLYYRTTPGLISCSLFTVKPEGSVWTKVSQFEFWRKLPMKPDPDFTSKNVIKMEGPWAAQRVHGQWMRTRTRTGRRGSRKHSSTPVPSFSFRSSSLPDLPVLWVCSNTPPIFYFSGWQRQKHKFQNVSTTTALRSNYPFS